MSDSNTTPVVAGLSWDAALRRADDLTAAAHPIYTPVGTGWEDTAMRDLVAVALYAVGLRDRTAVEDVPLSRVIVPLCSRGVFDQLVRGELTAAGHVLDRHDQTDPVVARWQWLHRTWDPDAPPESRWDGLPRMVARGLPDPAVDIMLNWAAGVVDRPLAVERGALPRQARVQVTGGEFAGQAGTVESPAWRHVPAGDAVEPGPPAGYLVRLDRLGSAGPVERILTADLEPDVASQR